VRLMRIQAKSVIVGGGEPFPGEGGGSKNGVLKAAERARTQILAADI
jgi:hypothetical protein